MQFLAAKMSKILAILSVPRNISAQMWLKMGMFGVSPVFETKNGALGVKIPVVSNTTYDK